jgi:hypothetical protein
LVHFTEPGKFPLGALSLHSYDPREGTYKTARAELGDVEVKQIAPSPSAGGQETIHGTADEPTSLITELAPAKALSHTAAASPPISDTPWYWALLFAVPGLSFVAQFASDRLKLAKGRRSERAQAPSTLANKALDEAESALKKHDTGACIVQLERALFLSLEAGTGLAARGVLRSELQSKLVAKGLNVELAQASAELLLRLENARFAGDSESPAVLTSDVRALARRLLKAA